MSNINTRINKVLEEAKRDRGRMDRDEMVNEWTIYEKHKRWVNKVCGFEAGLDKDIDLYDSTMKKITEILGV